MSATPFDRETVAKNLDAPSRSGADEAITVKTLQTFRATQTVYSAEDKQRWDREGAGRGITRVAM